MICEEQRIIYKWQQNSKKSCDSLTVKESYEAVVAKDGFVTPNLFGWIICLVYVCVSHLHCQQTSFLQPGLPASLLLYAKDNRFLLNNAGSFNRSLSLSACCVPWKW